MESKNKKPKSHQKWSWIFLVGFMILSIVDFRFGILAIVCMGTPLYHALKGRGKIHCSHYCPRGSFLARFLSGISLNRNMPAWMKSKAAKNTLLGLMVAMFALSIAKSGGDFVKMGFAMFRFMAASTVLGILMGIIYRPRSWCQVCPMGYSTGIIKNYQDAKKGDLDEASDVRKSTVA